MALTGILLPVPAVMGAAGIGQLGMTDLIITNGILGWVGLRLVKRVDQLDTKVDDHEVQLQLHKQQLLEIKHNT